MSKPRYLFSTCGWRGSSISSKSEMLSKFDDYVAVNQKATTRGLCYDALLTTDGGSFAKEPRLYMLRKRVSPYVGIDFITMMLALNIAAIECLGFNISGYPDVVDHEDCLFYDSKYTISEHMDYYLMTHVFFDEEFTAKCIDNGINPLPLKVFYIIDKEDFHIKSCSLSYEASEAIKDASVNYPAISLERMKNLSGITKDLFMSWKAVAEDLCVDSKYLEVVSGNCQITIDGIPQRVGGELTSCINLENDFEVYVGEGIILRQNGFNQDETGCEYMRGKSAICIVV